MIQTPFREAMLAAGFVHLDGPYEGKPNVRRFAQEMLGQDGDGDLESMERNVRRWIDTEDPGGPSLDMRRRAARILGVEPDELRLRPALEELVTRRQETDAALGELVLEVGSLAQQVLELRTQIEALRSEVAGHELAP